MNKAIINVTSPKNLAIYLLEPSREIVMGLEGVFMGSQIMEDEIFEHSITFCWEVACQQHTVHNIMGSRGGKKRKDC